MRTVSAPSTISSPEQLAYSVAAAAKAASLGRTTIYAAITSGELRSIKVGSRRLILVADLRAWLESLAEGAR